MTEIDAWYTLQNVFEVTDILEDKEYDLRNWRDVKEIVSILNKVTGNAFRLQKENEQLKAQLKSEHQQLENAILLERTRMGKNSLIQYKEAIQ